MCSLSPLTLEKRFVFQQDKEPKHTAKTRLSVSLTSLDKNVYVLKFTQSNRVIICNPIKSTGPVARPIAEPGIRKTL